MEAEWKTRAIRGAISVNDNTPESLEKATIELISEILEKNSIDKEDIISVIFTLTSDLDAAFPAKFARLQLGWDDIAMICTYEIPVPGSLPKCMRVLMHINSKLEKSRIKHVYMGKAANLRPDLIK